MSKLKEEFTFIPKSSRISWTFRIPENVLTEMKKYAKKYNMTLGEYIEALHKRYTESIKE